MNNLINSFFAISIGHRGPGLLIILLAIFFLFSFDKIMKLVSYLIEKLEERKKNKMK